MTDQRCLRADLAECPLCAAVGTEPCPFADLSPELIESAPITAGTSCVVEDDGVCESCQ